MGVKDHAMPYWKRYPLDYAMDTAHLTLAEHGAYTKLLDRYYLDGKLTGDRARLYVICACRTEDERAAVDRVVADYFTPCEDGLRQERVEREIAEYQAFRASRSRAGEKGSESRAAAKERRPRINGTPKADPLAGFEAFYSAYPRKVGRAAAERAWAKLKPDDALQAQMLAALRQQDASDAWAREGGQFIPHPSTWLNGRRWNDALTIEAPK